MLKNIEKNLLLERKFIFEAHHEKGFEKLRENQFAFPEQGIVHEPVANALDQQQGKEPIVITLIKEKNTYHLTFKDNGIGLVHDNLEALHFIGKSSKRNNKKNTIGRFGMGLVGAFNSHLGVKKVEINTVVCGRSSQIIYDCSHTGIPYWYMNESQENCHGFAITFTFPKSSHAGIMKALSSFLRQTIVPVDFNGNIICIDPSLMARKGDINISIEDEPTVHYVARSRAREWEFIDDIHLYLRKMPVEKDKMYPIFVSTGGSKLPQNYQHYDKPYMQNESCIVLSNHGEPTLGRDKFVRDKDFDKIKQSVETARCMALIKLFKKAMGSKSKRLKQYADDMATANIYTLRNLLVNRIQSNNSFFEHKEHTIDLVDYLINYPLFLTFNSPTPMSIHNILEDKSSKGVFFYAKAPDAAAFLDGEHNANFILKEKTYYFDNLWGGHEQRQIENILKPLLEQMEGIELISMEELLWNEKKLEELEERKIISRTPLKVRRVSSPDKLTVDFLDRLKTLLNRPWFRHSLVRFHPPKKIHLFPIQIKQRKENGEIIAAVLNGTDQDPDQLCIGICMDSLPMRSILKLSNGELAALPIICHELIHHRRKLVESDDNKISHNENFHLDRIQLEDKVLRNCVLHLLGKEDELVQDCGMVNESGEVLVL